MFYEICLNFHFVLQLIQVYNFFSCIGRRSLKVVPFPLMLSTWMEPPCSSIILLQMDKPKPVPVDFVVKKGSNACSISSRLIPQPLSLMYTNTSFCSTSVHKYIIPPLFFTWLIASMEFLRRLMITCLIWFLSP